MAASPRLTRALQQQLGDELSRELFTWMGQMESSRTELAELHRDFVKFTVQTNRRFDAIDARFVRIETRLEVLEGRVADIDARLGRIEDRFDRFIMLSQAQHAQLLRWAFVFWCGSVFAIVAVVLAAVK